MAARRAISPEDVFIRKLDGPPEPGFDCGTAEQNDYLYDHAWADQEESISVTYLHYAHGILAGYSTVSMDGVQLSFRERGIRLRYETVGAVKLAQLGVDRAFHGCGLGKLLVNFVVAQARVVSSMVACRYVSVDARAGLEPWYERFGFERNKLMQERMRRFALEKNRDPDGLATSMRVDIRAFG